VNEDGAILRACRDMGTWHTDVGCPSDITNPIGVARDIFLLEPIGFLVAGTSEWDMSLDEAASSPILCFPKTTHSA
jgi:hypothetical protein